MCITPFTEIRSAARWLSKSFRHTCRKPTPAFSVKGGLQPAVTNDGIKEVRQEKTRARISKEASNEIKAKLEKKLKNVIAVSYTHLTLPTTPYV